MVLLWRVWILWNGNMNNSVSMIVDDKLIRSHTEYDILNKRWKLVEDCSLSVYLSTLKLEDTDDDQRWWPFVNFSKIQNFYLRVRTINEIITKKDVKNDPWNRQFIVYPPDLVGDNRGGVYTYYNYYSKKLDLEVVVIVTTVNRSRVYCVDVIK
jgi:hypothetical protein